MAAARPKDTPKAPLATASEEGNGNSNGEIITVVSTVPANAEGGHKCVLWEKHSAHPGGEALIAGPHRVKVGKTAEINKLLHDGTLQEVAE